jgi:hypothetical protein
MTFLKILLLLILTFVTNAHTLPHQNNITNPNCEISPEITLTTFDKGEVDYWSDTEFSPSFKEAEFIDYLPENTVSSEEVINNLVFDDDGEIDLSKSNIDCSIYVDIIGNPIGYFCGETDYFMKAALSAINYCATLNVSGIGSGINLVPYFVGPQNLWMP